MVANIYIYIYIYITRIRSSQLKKSVDRIIITSYNNGVVY